VGRTEADAALAVGEGVPVSSGVVVAAGVSVGRGVAVAAVVGTGVWGELSASVGLPVGDAAAVARVVVVRVGAAVGGVKVATGPGVRVHAAAEATAGVAAIGAAPVPAVEAPRQAANNSRLRHAVAAPLGVGRRHSTHSARVCG
jgi:hypothetical protein